MQQTAAGKASQCSPDFCRLFQQHFVKGFFLLFAENVKLAEKYLKTLRNDDGIFLTIAWSFIVLISVSATVVILKGDSPNLKFIHITDFSFYVVNFRLTKQKNHLKQVVFSRFYRN
ncbi:MAG: hypothetical protein ACLU99_02120 [Alphaproteobacteria bacterium]